MMTLCKTILSAIRNCEFWEGGAVVVADDEGMYNDIPGTILNDAHYAGPRRVVWTIQRQADALGPGRRWWDYTVDELQDLAEDIARKLEQEGKT